METFEYSVIRYVPKVEREEFVNIGVIVFSKRYKFLDVKFHLNTEKIKALGTGEDLDVLHAHLQSWRTICAGDIAGGVLAEKEMPYRFRWLTAARSTIIQSSRPHPGRCDDPAKVLEDLFMKYVS